MTALPRLAVLASGRGSNLQALLDATASGALQARVVGVFSDRAQAVALERARRAGVPALSRAPAGFESREAFDAALFADVDAVAPDFVVCAGYLRLLSDAVVARWQGRMLNIHPSLLPEFKGLRTHARALAAGHTVHGASVHYLTPDLDGGPVIAQARVPVQPGDDADRLAERVLAREHPLLVATLALVCAGRVALDGDRVRVDGVLLEAPLQLGANDGFA